MAGNGVRLAVCLLYTSCPIYGFGMVIVLFALTPLQNSVLLLYIGGVILPSALELVGGWALYKLCLLYTSRCV